jgi:uncharacterized membrane protein YgcG
MTDDQIILAWVLGTVAVIALFVALERYGERRLKRREADGKPHIPPRPFHPPAAVPAVARVSHLPASYPSSRSMLAAPSEAPRPAPLYAVPPSTDNSDYAQAVLLHHMLSSRDSEREAPMPSPPTPSYSRQEPDSYEPASCRASDYSSPSPTPSYSSSDTSSSYSSSDSGSSSSGGGGGD